MLTLDIIEKEIENVIQHGNNREDISCLANLYLCRMGLKGESNQTVHFDSESEFASTVEGKSYTAVLPVIDELMETLKVLNPRLHDSVIRKLK